MKRKNLEIMKKSGINIPDFFVLHWQESVEKDKLSNALFNFFSEKKDESFAEQSIHLKNILNEFIHIPKIPVKNNVLYAVRSSCNMEDGEKYSFAGMFNTYLNIGAEEVPARICDCLKSLYNQTVLEYCRLKEIDITLMKMDVIIQEMVEGDFSGILFTSNPQGILNEAVITVGKGLGDGVVSDRVQTVTYYYNISDKKYYYDGTEDILEIDVLNQLITVGDKIKNILGYSYADIEFSIIEKELYILQARRITSIEDEEIEIFDNSNIVESYPGFTLPLSASFACAAYTGVFTGLANRIWRNQNMVRQHSHIFENMVGSVNGVMYYKINSWYKILHLLPFGKKVVPIWQEMLGVKNKQVISKEIRLPLFFRIKTYFRFIYEFFSVEKSMRKLNEYYVAVKRDFEERFSENLTNSEMRKLYKDIEKKLLKRWDITLINDLYAFLFTAAAKKKSRNDQINERISGIKDMESMKPLKDLIELAELLSKEGKSINYFAQRNDYIQKYGDRTLEELKLESKTFRTNPELLDKKAEEYAADSTKLEEMKNNIWLDEKRFEKKAKDNFFTRRALKGIGNREISRLNRTSIYGMVRSIFLAIGKNLVSQNRLECVEDIYYLKVEEIFREMDSQTNLMQITKKRKEEYESYKKMPVYNLIAVTKNGLHKLNRFLGEQKDVLQKDFLYGVPCSSGKISGSVLVIKNAEDAKNGNDKILVARTTDPGWVFLLANAKGIITEKGSLLSHTAIIARELKIPSVVAVENATELLKTGDIVEMDGNTGEIRVIKKQI